MSIHGQRHVLDTARLTYFKEVTSCTILYAALFLLLSELKLQPLRYVLL